LRQHRREDVQPDMPEQGEPTGSKPSDDVAPPGRVPHVDPRGEVPPPPVNREQSPTGELSSSLKPTCQSGRQPKAPDRLGFNGGQGFGYSAEAINRQQMQATAMIRMLMDRIVNTEPRNRAGTYQSLMLTYLSEGFADYSDPIAYAAATGSEDPETLRYHEAMSATDWENFGTAAGIDITTLESIGT
jgi:hypothetical protein